jgi:hypothetical protein
VKNSSFLVRGLWQKWVRFDETAFSGQLPASSKMGSFCEKLPASSDQPPAKLGSF